MSHDHISESDLISYAFDSDTIPARQREHLRRCSDCRSSFDFFVAAEADLRSAEAWEPLVGSPSYDALSEYVKRVEAEDEEATELLAEFIRSPAAAAWSSLLSKRRYHTGGIVRRLTTQAHQVAESDPLAALTFAEHAVQIAELLRDDLYPARAVYQLRGTAWKERANAQLVRGDFPAALVSLDRAEEAYRHLASPGLGLAVVALVRAAVFYEQGRLDAADGLAQQAEKAFSHFEDDKRRMSAGFLRASIAFEARNLTTAVELFGKILAHCQKLGDTEGIARASHALGICEVERKNLSEASRHLHTALAIFRELGPEPYRLATEWGLARAVLQGGRLPEAIRRLEDVAEKYETIGLATDAALVGLDVAGAWLELKQWDRIVELAQHIFAVFMKAGMLTGALSAIAYLKEAAVRRRLQHDDIETLRKFLRRAERQPALQFVPPPLRPPA